MGIGDWGMGIGDWGLGSRSKAQGRIGDKESANNCNLELNKLNFKNNAS